jgi:MraZ protein
MMSNKGGQVANDDIEQVVPVAAGGGFASNFLHSLDPKKRITIPAVWRDQVGEPQSLYVLPGMNDEKCLYVYPAREMARRLEKLRKISISDKKARMFARLLASSSELIALDSQGRIRIKDELLAGVGIVSRVKLVGAFDRFEIWGPEEWDKNYKSIDQAAMEDAVRYVEF